MELGKTYHHTLSLDGKTYRIEATQFIKGSETQFSIVVTPGCSYTYVYDAETLRFKAEPPGQLAEELELAIGDWIEGMDE